MLRCAALFGSWKHSFCSDHSFCVVPEFHFSARQNKCQSGNTASASNQSTLSFASQDLFAPDSMIQSSSKPPQTRTIVSVCESILPSSVGFVKTSESDVMPLAQHLKNGYLTGRPEAWHRSDERITRGLAPIVDPNVPLDDWERALAWMEILLVSGSTDECFAHWTRGWGHDNEVQRIMKQLLERNPA